jgi:hypothetical protein
MSTTISGVSGNYGSNGDVPSTVVVVLSMSSKYQYFTVEVVR